MSWPAGQSLGLRVRLLLAFALLCVVTAAGVAGASYGQARTAILQRAQDAAVREMTDRLDTLFPLRNPAPRLGELDEIASTVTDRNSSAVALYHGQRSRLGLDPGAIPGELRAAVGHGDVAWQRVVRHGEPRLIIGAPLLIVERDRGVRPSGVEVYTSRSLEAEQISIDKLAVAAWLSGLAALAFAVVLALLAARGVLRPVRELGRAAHRLGECDLSARVPVRGSDEPAGVANTFNNTAAELSRHVAQLRDLEADARRFVADVSHELRTPLTALTAVADVLDDEAGRLPEPAGSAAALVSRETHNLTRLVNDLIEISRFDAGRAVLTLDEVDVAELVHATLRARGWSESVHTELPPGVTARLDPRRVDVILANLVGNALRHGEPPVSVRLAAEPDWLRIEVRDHGPGLDLAVLPHVFDRFFKADVARARSEGSGLGLAIAQENARLHRDDRRGGGITATNDPDGGAVFTIYLPRRARAADVR